LSQEIAVYFRKTVWRGPWHLFGEAATLEEAHHGIENVLDTVAPSGEACIFAASKPPSSAAKLMAGTGVPPNADEVASWEASLPRAPSPAERAAMLPALQKAGVVSDPPAPSSVWQPRIKDPPGPRHPWPQRFTDGNEPGRLIYQITAVYRRTIEGLRRGG
jgi:hypothetical protein